MVGFLCTQFLPNYITDVNAYSYLPGKVSSTGYYYYILLNHNVKNITLVRNFDEMQKCEAIVFHYDDYSLLKNYKGKLIQVVTDRPYIKGLDAYICCNQFMLTPKPTLELCKVYPFESLLFKFIDERWFFVHYPPTFNVKKCTPVFPPVNFKYVGRKHTLRKSLLNETNIKRIESTLNIKLNFDFVRDNNVGDEHIYFCLRDLSHISAVTKEANIAGINGNKTPNRLYQSWYMNTPGIFNISPEMESIRQDEFDYTVANNFEEFYRACQRFVTDEAFYNTCVKRCIERCDENNPYCNLKLIVSQWGKVFDFLGVSVII